MFLFPAGMKTKLQEHFSDLEVTQKNCYFSIEKLQISVQASRQKPWPSENLVKSNKSPQNNPALINTIF